MRRRLITDDGGPMFNGTEAGPDGRPIGSAKCAAYLWDSRMKTIFQKQLALIALITLWLSFEFLHHRWEIEWPWLCLGNGLASQNKIIQWYEYTGMPGGSLWILLSNTILFSFWRKLKSSNKRAALAWLVLWGIGIAAPVLWSLNKYSNYSESGVTIKVAALQPNIDPFSYNFV